jgi:hypothetical protein
MSIAIAMITTPATVRAQETNKPAAKQTKHAKPSVTPLHGKVKSVDQTAKTITVGKTTVQITSETRFLKDGKPATLEDVTVGENIGGAYKKSADGKKDATMIRIGPKPESAKKARKTK